MGALRQISNGTSLDATADSSSAANADLSHTFWNGVTAVGDAPYGQGVYEFIGTGNGLPTRIDVDNDGNPISDCADCLRQPTRSTVRSPPTETSSSLASLGRKAGQMQSQPPTKSGPGSTRTTSYDASASQCTRTAGDPGGACNAPANATFEGATTDGSRVFFTTKQQLVNGDTNQTNDLYAYDLPTASNPNPSLIDVSGSASSERQGAGRRALSPRTGRLQGLLHRRRGSRQQPRRPRRTGACRRLRISTSGSRTRATRKGKRSSSAG